jgi:hypothetical protein
MSIEVLIAQTGGEESVRTWGENSPIPSLAEWQRAALWLARRARDQRDFHAEVFLCLKAGHLVYDFEYEFCRELCNAARRYCWNAKLYVTVDERIDFNREQLENVPHLVTWLGGLHEGRGRPTDVLLANFDRMAPLQSYHLTDLRRARDMSILRYEMMPGLIIPDQWHCWAASKEYQPWLADVSANDARNLIIVIKDSRSVRTAVNQARAKVEAHPGGRFVIGCLGKGEVSRGVAGLARELNLPVMRFRGLLELRYFLWRLNRLCQGQGRSEALSKSVEAVPVGSPVFHSADGRRARLLITCAFDPDRHDRNCLDAVADVGAVARAAPPHAECYVHPYFRAADLPGLFRRMPELTAWLHLGHGDGSGLRDITGDLIKLDDWFTSLRHATARLPLLVLSVCKSARVARRFAAAGVGVAIGFENQVLPDMCRALAETVVPTALNQGGNREAILRAYNEAFRNNREGAAISKPRAFYSVL